MQEEWVVIGQVILELVNRYFPRNENKKYIEDFISFKINSHFPFGQLVILHYQMFNGLFRDIFKVAAVVELIILSLEIIDESNNKDNAAVPWKNIDRTISMNIAYALISLSLKTLDQTTFDQKRKAIAKDYLNTLVMKAVKNQPKKFRKMVETRNHYAEIIREKIGTFIASACQIGTALANDKSYDIVKKYSENFRIIIQIRNDMNNFYYKNFKKSIS